jgi:hypothetical protein
LREEVTPEAEKVMKPHGELNLGGKVDIEMVSNFGHSVDDLSPATLRAMVKRRMGKLKHAPPQHHTPVTPFPYHLPAQTVDLAASRSPSRIGKTRVTP